MPAYTSDPFTIPPSALPHLESFRSVHVDPDTLGEVCTLVHPVFCPVRSTAAAQVVATRPVQGISLSLFSEHGYRALEALARTSTPVRRLTILILDASAPSELFPQLAARLPHLEALHIVALVQQYNLVRHPSFSSSPTPAPVVLNVERFCRIRCSRPPRCSKPSPACDFSRLSLAARRVMNSTMKRLSRSSGHVRVRPCRPSSYQKVGYGSRAVRADGNIHNPFPSLTVGLNDSIMDQDHICIFMDVHLHLRTIYTRHKSVVL
jgi:hypothetical protein